jgi:hypothetical protein
MLAERRRLCQSGKNSGALRWTKLLKHRPSRTNLIANSERFRDVVEPASDTRIAARVSEISRKGCYVDVLVTLPTGTLIQLKILRDQGSFTTKGKIIYVQEGMGMGVAFVDIAEDQLKILDGWLVEIAS